jgi:aryl-alcohol dehydrogenase-like predicted oxidoreductase
MQYIHLGKSDLKVSRMALGLGLRGQSSADEAQRLIEHAIDSGINFIDCANKYCLKTGQPDAHGSSEEILGRVLAMRRDELVITSKVGSDVGPGPEECGCSRRHILEQAEQSLRKLRTDYIDLYLLHVFDPHTPLEETLQAMDELVQSGKVRYVGCSNYQAWQVCKGLWLADRMDWAPFVCIQNNYNLLNRSLEREMFPMIRDQQLGVMAFSPLAVGLLSGTYLPGEPPPPGTLWGDRRKEYDSVMQGAAAVALQTAHDVARKGGHTLTQLAFNWVLAHEEISVVIAGTDTIEQLDDILGSLDWKLADEEFAELSRHFVERMVW